MKITIDTLDSAELEHLLGWLRDNNLLDRVALNPPKTPDMSLIVRGDKTLDPDGLRGIWKDNPRTLEDIRSESWRI